MFNSRSYFIVSILIAITTGSPPRHEGVHSAKKAFLDDTGVWLRSRKMLLSWLVPAPKHSQSHGPTSRHRHKPMNERNTMVTSGASFETLWRNGSKIVTKVIGSREKTGINVTGTSLTQDFVPELFDNRRRVDLTGNVSGQRYRTRRLIFPPDERIKVNTTLAANTFPFSACVKISTGCTGSLISRQHVLTSAHCVHNGKSYLQRTRSLQVGFLRRGGKVRWVDVRFIRIPSAWTKDKHIKNDYAVLKLVKPHKRTYFSLAVVGKTKPHRKTQIHFTSFPGDKRSNTLWYAHCAARVLSDSIIGRCDASRGSSGAGVYINYRSSHSSIRVIVGILSGSGTATKSDGRSRRFNAATKITGSMSSQICRWIDAAPNCALGSRKTVAAGRSQSRG